MTGSSRVPAGMGERPLSAIDHHSAGPAYLHLSAMLPKRCHGPLEEWVLEFPSLRAAHGADLDASCLRAGLSGKRWHSYVSGPRAVAPQVRRSRANPCA